MRRYVSTKKIEERRALIPEHDVFARVLSAIRVTDADPPVRPSRVKSNWPTEFENVAMAIKWAVWRGKPLEDKLYRKLRIGDFEDIWFGETEGSPESERQRFKPGQVADAIIAGSWFAALQRLHENIDEAEAAHEAYRLGNIKTALITDQKILTWYAKGFTMKSIGAHSDIKLDEHQVERRLNEISRSLFRIANGYAALVDLDARRRAQERVQAYPNHGRERVGFASAVRDR